MFHFDVSCRRLLRLWVMALLSLTLTALHSHAQCTAPPGKQGNAILSHTEGEYAEGSKVTYECIPGYVIQTGSSSITCSNGAWSDLSLTCQKKSCGSPAEVVNGQWVYEDITFGATITLKCNTGYKAGGQTSTMQCMSGGWSGEGFVCEAVKCPLPPKVQNGECSLSEDKEYLLYQESIIYTCEKSYTLIGESQLRCTESGTYNTQPPECKKVNCPQPVVEFGMRVEGGPPPYGHRSYIVYECNEGYQMKGSSKIICEDNTWSPKPPICQKKVNCPQPVVEFGMRVEGGPPPYGHSSYIVYECNEGYQMKGSSKIICEDNTWSPKVPICQKKVNCPQPVVDFGTQVKGGPPPYGHSSYIVYECNKGYQMKGSSKIICEDNTWSPKVPICQKSGASCTGSLCTEVYSVLIQRVLMALLIPVSLHLSQ
ncbi:hypothetical protein SKAU_G00104950 [Synaphobranchus kaupii]|uniref:Sushi domain-containing protein n=1 Tax=Synaphobranchus kaupii TaxID=118154 RepID=A0A9Q1FZI3_SYNKA|nr:hypothetical protein SKAU_G00104950 [Synaphobranchus kaupii]